MAYDIKHLDNAKLQQKLYLFDSNLWIKIIKPQFHANARTQKYLDFFKKFLKDNANPKIALPALVLSEVINRIMREVAYTKFLTSKGLKKQDVDPGYYKTTYRKDPHFNTQYQIILDEIRLYHNKYELVNDELGKLLKTNHIITTPASGLDYNDHFYHQLAKKKGYSIITDDIDFFVEDVEILTYNNDLYQKYKDTIKPISK